MTTYEIDAWLGDTEATDEQRAAIQRAADRIAERWPEEDLDDLRERALVGAAQIILGDDDLSAFGARYHRAQRAALEAHAELTGALIASEGTASEQRLGEIVGLSRQSVRKALGK